MNPKSNDLEPAQSELTIATFLERPDALEELDDFVANEIRRQIAANRNFFTHCCLNKSELDVKFTLCFPGEDRRGTMFTYMFVEGKWITGNVYEFGS